MGEFTNINDINAYIDSLINQVFSILPVYEESGYTKSLEQKIFNMSVKLDGFFRLYDFQHTTVIDILSLMNELQATDEHKKIRSCVLKVCSLLTQLKVVDSE